MRRLLIGFEQRILFGGLLAFAPLLAVVILLAMSRDLSTDERWLAGAALVVSIVMFIAVIRGQLVYRMRTLSNVIGALREEDYSIRLRDAAGGGAFGEVSYEIDRLTDALREQRLGALEAAALVRTVIGEIDSAIFAFDARDRLQLVNRSGERLLARYAEQLLGRKASELGLDELLHGDAAETREVALPGGSGRWLIKRSAFREKGVPHRLLVMSDLSRALREEERLAWQRLLRVLGHELNNSLAPIRSIATSLQDLVARDERPTDWLDDVQRGLAVIGSRSASLTRFMEAYAKLTRLPRPVWRKVDVAEMVNRVAGLESRVTVDVSAGPPVIANADPDQIEQLLINLLRNAADSSLEAGGGNVAIRWSADEHWIDITVTDQGSGISGTSNLFVPFFTTKPGGSGVGLALSRLIAEAHGGEVTLENRSDGGRGAVARLRLPVGAVRSA
jgi:nitrogen fixation/metabolism regulation signal transduction histidine kinase